MDGRLATLRRYGRKPIPPPGDNSVDETGDDGRQCEGSLTRRKRQSRSASEGEASATGKDAIEPYLSGRELAEVLGVNEATVRKWCSYRKGFPRHKIGNLNRFRLSEVLAHFDERRKHGHKKNS